MHTEKISLEHQELLSDKFKKLLLPISEYSFASLYLFREKHEYEMLFDEEIFIKGKTFDGESFIMPSFDIRQSDKAYLRKMITQYGMIFPVPEEWIPHFENDGFIFTSNEGDADYIHHVKKISDYKGKHLHGKRNLLNQFLDSYAHEECPLTDDRLGDANTILESWQKETNDKPLDTDFYPCAEAIKLYDRLILCGGIFYANREPAGFIIGEELNDETFALHFAKGNRKFKGIYQYMFNSFANVMPAKYCCFNFEQDMGKESLRQAKLSYKPEKMILKYRMKSV